MKASLIAILMVAASTACAANPGADAEEGSSALKEPAPANTAKLPLRTEFTAAKIAGTFTTDDGDKKGMTPKECAISYRFSGFSAGSLNPVVSVGIQVKESDTTYDQIQWNLSGYVDGDEALMTPRRLERLVNFPPLAVMKEQTFADSTTAGSRHSSYEFAYKDGTVTMTDHSRTGIAREIATLTFPVSPDWMKVTGPAHYTRTSVHVIGDDTVLTDVTCSDFKLADSYIPERLEESL